VKQQDIERGGTAMASGKTDQAVGKIKQQADKVVDKVKDSTKH
jgi:uncharacterized protein YjbJ (UPF0337 family)